MAQDINITLIGGRLVADPTVRNVGKKQVANFRLASSRSYKKDDEWQEIPTFIDCEVWGPVAERVGKMSKGTRVLLRAQLNQDEWEDKNGGGKRSKHKLTVFEVQNLTGKNGGSSESEDSESSGGADDDLPF